MPLLKKKKKTSKFANDAESLWEFTISNKHKYDLMIYIYKIHSVGIRPKQNTEKRKLCAYRWYNKEWIYLYIPGKFVLRKCVFQKEFLIYAKCRELIERCCMKFIQTCQSFFPVFFFFSNNFQFTSYKYVTFEYPKVHRPTYVIWFLLMISRQTNHKFEYGMVS